MCNMPKTATPKQYYYLRDNCALYFDLTIYTTKTSSFIKVSINDGCYHVFKINVYDSYFDNRLIDLLNKEFNLNIPNNNCSMGYVRAIKYCLNSIAEQFGLTEFVIADVQF